MLARVFDRSMMLHIVPRLAPVACSPQYLATWKAYMIRASPMREQLGSCVELVLGIPADEGFVVVTQDFGFGNNAPFHLGQEFEF